MGDQRPAFDGALLENISDSFESEGSEKAEDEN